jgi:hypothetical protein
VKRHTIDFRGFRELERALIREPLKLNPARARRLIAAASWVDASIWREEMEKLRARGFTGRHPQWEQLSLEKTIPWIECKAQLVLTTGMPFCEVLQLTGSDLRLSACETRLAGIGRHQLTQECAGLLEVMVTLGQRALFPWEDAAQATRLWLRAYRNGGLMRGHSRPAS